MNRKRIKLWDLPTRAFHWMLVLAVVAAYITGTVGGNAIEWHARIGLATVGLVVFRLVWGLIGSTHARFLNFFPTPAKIRAYLSGKWHGVGHNPLGACSVLALIALTALQALTGLFANDDIAFSGPLAALVSEAVSDTLTEVHEGAINALVALVVLHVAAILYYAHVKKDNLLKPMITGWKEVAPDPEAPTTGGGVLAFALALVIALGAVYAAAGAWIPAPPPPPAVTTPAW